MEDLQDRAFTVAALAPEDRQDMLDDLTDQGVAEKAAG